MKRMMLLMAIVCSLFAIQSCGNDKTASADDKDKKEISAGSVPDAVKTAFGAKYPAASDVKWEDAHENDKQTYKAKFTVGDKKMKAEFETNGTFVKESED